MTYYNTNKLQGPDFHDAVNQTEAQKSRVLKFFKKKRNRGRHLPVYYVHENVMPNARYTSCQRCITDLTKEGYLEKTAIMVPGPKGVQVHTWKVKEQAPARQLALL